MFKKDINQKDYSFIKYFYAILFFFLDTKDKIIAIKIFFAITTLIEWISINQNILFTLCKIFFFVSSVIIQKYSIKNTLTYYVEQILITIIQIFSFGESNCIPIVLFLYYLQKVTKSNNKETIVSSKIQLIINCILSLTLNNKSVIITLFHNMIPIMFIIDIIDEYLQAKETLFYLNQSLTGLMICKEDKSQNRYNCIYCNRRTAEIFNCNEDQVNDTIRGMTNKSIYTDIISKEIIQYKRYIANHKDNKSEGIILHSVALGKDKDIRVVSLNKLNQERFAIEQSIYKESKTQILISILHELNNPVTALLHYTQKVLGELEEEDTKKNELITRMKLHRFHLKLFSREISLFIKLMLNEIPKVKLSNFNLMFILNKLLNKFQTVFEVKQIKLRTEIKINSNIVMYSDYEIFKFFLSNIFTYISIKCNNKQMISFVVEMKDNKICRGIFLVDEKEEEDSNKEIESHLKDKEINKKSKLQNIFDFSGEAKTFDEPKIIQFERNVQSLEMLIEIIQKLSYLLNLQTTVKNNEIIVEFEIKQCESIQDLDYIEKSCYEFSPYTMNQNIKNRTQLSRTILPHSNFAEMNSRKYQSSTIINIPSYLISETSSNNDNNPMSYYSDSCYNTNIDFNGVDGKGLENIDKCKMKLLNYCNNKSTQNQIEDNFFETNNKYLFHPKGKASSDKSFIKKNSLFDINTKNQGKSSFSPRSPILIESSTIRKNELTLNALKKRRSSEQKIFDSISNIGCDCKEILVVDDEEFIQSTMSNVIYKRFGIIPDQCSNGIDVVDKLKKELTKKCCNIHYKLIFMDINMPGMGGFSACENIKRILPTNYKLAIIIISAYANMDDVQRIMKSNSFVKGFTQKPIKKSLIIDYVNKYLSG